MTEVVQPIPARLKNVAVGGHVAGADDIIDDALGIVQSDVNEKVIALENSNTKTLHSNVSAYIDNVVYYPSTADSKIGLYLLNDSSVRQDQPLPFIKDGIVGVYDNPFGIETDTGVTLENNALYNVIPGRYYFLRISGLDKLQKLYFEKSRRFIWADVVRNVRDFGGIIVSDGRKIAYNRIFRGSEIVGDKIPYSEDAINALKRLGITCDIDLRSSSEITQPNPLHVNYVNIPFIQFSALRNLTDNDKAKIKTAFEAVANEIIAGGSVYMHCAIGFHRCGLLAAIVEGVLGIDQNDMDKDYELSSFSNLFSVSRLDRDYVIGIKAIKEQYNDSWETLLIRCGVSDELIKNFRDELLIESEDVSKPNYIEVTYKELVDLRNSGSLVPGAFYRMIDYETLIYKNSDVPPYGLQYSNRNEVLGKPFDLVILSLSEASLSDKCYAVKSARDVEGYFNDEDLCKWDLRYDLDNNAYKYAWALSKERTPDNTEGKGVIFYMRDENGNTASYDFKNILFAYNDKYVLSIPENCENVEICSLFSEGCLYLNANVLLTTVARNIVFKENTEYIVITGEALNVKIGKFCTEILLENPENCVIKNDCHNIKILGCIVDAVLGIGCFNLELVGDESERSLIVEDYVNNVSGGFISPYTLLKNGITYTNETVPVTKLYYKDGTIKYVAVIGVLTDIDIPNKENLYKVEISNGVTSIGSYAFSNCTRLTSVTIPNSVTSIGNSAFFNCYSLTSVTIPDGVTSIGNSAFMYCSRLTSVTIPNGVTSIGSYVFRECSSLTSVTIPNSVTSISEGVFYDCRSLTSVTIGSGVTSIGSYAFFNCTSLTSITIPNGVTSIGSDAFHGCIGLSSVTIGSGMISIGNSAFFNCTSLTSVTIPNSVTSIGNSAFMYCSSLTSIICLPVTPPALGNKAIPSNVATIEVPAQSVDSYKSATVWSIYSDKIVAIQ